MSGARVVNEEKWQYYNNVKELFYIRIQHLKDNIQVFFTL
ncbi:hypothetical protein WC5_03854 [Escherichia sp. KTE114]|nr:hypothetical protein WC5_03854 [Escherichia sp. KTE114]